LAVADDLTGAQGLAGRWAGRRGPAWVATQAGSLRGLAGPRVLSAETRFLEPAAARAAVARAWGALAPAGALCFQKLDSTLRGNPGEEVEALLMATGAPWVAVQPAYPELGRQVLGGRVLVHGRRLGATEYARDPLTPSRAESVVGLFPRHLAAHAPLAAVRGGSAGLRAWIRRARGRGARFLGFDCAEALDQARVARACLAEGGRHFAGAADLGGALAAEALGPARRPQRPRGLPWLVLAGTVSASTFAQLARLAAGRCHWEARLRRRGRGFSVEAAPLAGLRAAWAREGALALSSLAARGDLAAWRAHGARQGRRAAGVADDAIAGLVAWGLRLTGGHTLAAFYRHCGFDRCRIDGELLREAPLGLAQGPGGAAWVASKPGGFGDEAFLERFLEAVA
jgi:uncharacterized protein YgbK (DUF1537 family)